MNDKLIEMIIYTVTIITISVITDDKNILLY